MAEIKSPRDICFIWKKMFNTWWSSIVFVGKVKGLSEVLTPSYIYTILHIYIYIYIPIFGTTPIGLIPISLHQLTDLDHQMHTVSPFGLYNTIYVAIIIPGLL